jgi:hypothetical protein
MAQFGNVFVYPVIQPLNSQSASTQHDVDRDAMFLMVANGPEEAGWDLLEERVSTQSQNLDLPAHQLMSLLNRRNYWLSTWLPYSPATPNLGRILLLKQLQDCPRLREYEGRKRGQDCNLTEEPSVLGLRCQSVTHKPCPFKDRRRLSKCVMDCLVC